MDPLALKSESDAPRKRKFVPKAPPRRVPKAEVKAEAVEDVDGEQARDLLKRFNEGLIRTKPKVEKKVAKTQIAFGYGGASTTIKSYGAQKPRIGQNHRDSPPTGIHEEKEYQEPWDYYSNYPTTLPLRRPYSGNPQLLDEEEFGASQETVTYDETRVKTASDLDLVEENSEARMLFLQLPSTLPLTKRSAIANGEEVTGGSMGSRVAPNSCPFNELPAGPLGKMLVYRSGAIKLRIGDTLFDVSSGMNCVFAQDVVAINTAEKQCCIVGELNKRAIVTPDLDSILQCVEDL